MLKIISSNKKQYTGKGKDVPVLNYMSRNEDALGEWTYSSTHS
jgi:hypothetical protein